MRLLVPFITLFLALTASGRQYHKPYGDLKEDQKFRDYEVRIYHNDEDLPDSETNPDHQFGLGCFEILRAGKQVYFEKGEFFAIGDVTPESHQTITNSIKMGQSITSDRKPNLLISEWTSGSGCCNTFHVFELGQRLKVIATLEAEYYDISEFRDLRRDGNLEFVTADFTYSYWHVGCVASHSPLLILRYRHGHYLIDLEMMKKPAPPKQELEEMGRQFEAEFAGAVKDFDADKWVAPYQMWQKMLDLIYSGNMKSAWRLCDLSWPANHQGKSEFLREFKELMRTSPYYQDICSKSFQN